MKCYFCDTEGSTHPMLTGCVVALQERVERAEKTALELKSELARLKGDVVEKGGGIYCSWHGLPHDPIARMDKTNCPFYLQEQIAETEGELYRLRLLEATVKAELKLQDPDAQMFQHKRYLALMALFEAVSKDMARSTVHWARYPEEVIRAVEALKELEKDAADKQS